MKVIDLLNKIANGEDVPYRIKYIGKIYEYVEDIKWYLREDMKCELSNSKECLNDEVEIIEEDKKIEKIKLTNGGLTLHKIVDDIEEDIPINSVERTLVYTINKIIDYLEENK